MTEANLYHQKILLTGASGFVGSAIRIALQSAGAEVVGVSRSGIGGTRARQVAADSDWTDLLEGVTCVVHAAAVVHFLSDKDRPTEQVYRDVNVDGTLALARQAAEAGVERFVFISTAKVAGEGNNSGRQAYKENDDPQPQGAYSLSKWYAEEGLTDLSRSSSSQSGMQRKD